MPAVHLSPSLTSLAPLRPLTVDETAELIRRSHRTVERLLADGTLKTVQPLRRGRPPMILVSSVRSLLEGGVEG